MLLKPRRQPRQDSPASPRDDLARDPRKKRLRREGYVRNRATLPGSPESRRVALVEDDEPGPGDEVQDVFPPGVGRVHSPLDGPRVVITANDNVPSGAEHALLQTINFVAEVLDGLVWGEVATEESYIPTPYPDESSSTSVTSCEFRAQKAAVPRLSGIQILGSLSRYCSLTRSASAPSSRAR
ncbi:hypothetical protein J6590_061772 [Homalodisca vitripennis]|nr:hypothetical protein J6590_061772 [Homalodisca vitripennis]